MAEKNKKNELKRIYFSVEYRYPKEMDDEKILDRFAEQILKDASDINSDSIQIMNGNDREVHCPKCGNPIVGITREIGSYKGLGITEHESYCNKCDISIIVEDRSAYEQEGKIIITYV